MTFAPGGLIPIEAYMKEIVNTHTDTHDKKQATNTRTPASKGARKQKHTDTQEHTHTSKHTQKQHKCILLIGTGA